MSLATLPVRHKRTLQAAYKFASERIHRDTDQRPRATRVTATDDEMGALSAVEQLEQRLISAGSPYELETVQANDDSYRVYRHAPSSLNEVYTRARKMGEAILAVFGERRVSYAEAFSEAALIARMLRTRFAVAPGVRVAIALHNGPEWLSAFLAVTSMGATAVLIDIRNTATILHGLRTTSCKLAIVESDMSCAAASTIKTLRALIIVGARHINLSSWPAHTYRWAELRQAASSADTAGIHNSLETSSHLDLLPSVYAPREAIIAFTSGTTGVPKGAVLTHRGIITGLMNMTLAGCLADVAFPRHGPGAAPAQKRARQAPCALVLSPLSYIAGYAQVLLGLIMGGKVVLQDRWDAKAVCRLIDCEQVQSIIGATPEHIRELMHLKPEPGSLGSIGFHGFPLHRTLLEEIADHWPLVRIASGYGMTETNGSVAAIAGETLKRYTHCVGRVLPTIDLRIVGAGGVDVQPGEVGEVWLRGASLMQGYSTECERIDGLVHGWFRTGDLGRVLSHRFLSLVDRMSQAVISGPQQIFPLNLERVAAYNEGVAEVAVLLHEPGSTGNAHDKENISVVVFVVRKAGSLLDKNTLRLKVAEGGPIAASAITIVEVLRLPKTRSGKVDRSELHAMLSSGQLRLDSSDQLAQL
jgi:steroid-24-oyl-CoA synthetase